MPGSPNDGGRAPLTIDLTAALGLVLLTLIVRLSGLGPDGFHPDDAWIATAVGHAGSVQELIKLGFSHPGYNTLVRLIVGNDGSGVGDYQVVAFVAGLLSVPAFYALIVRTSGSRLLAMAIGLTVALAPLHFRFSAAVKPYTLEMLVTCLALLYIARPRQWSWRAIAVWLLLFMPVVTLGIHNALLSLAVTLGLFWSRAIDLRKTLVLLVGQAVMLGPWVLWVQSGYDSERLQEWWLGSDDGFIDQGLNTPVDTMVHLRRAVRSLVDAPSVLAWILTAAVIVGCVLAVRLREPVISAATFCVLIAIGGGVTHTVPFGPLYINSTRLDMWLAPAFAVLAISGPVLLLRGRFSDAGVAADADAAAGGLGGRTSRGLLVAICALLVAGAAYTIVRPPDPYPSRNANTQLAAARSVVEARGPRAILIGRNAAPFFVANQYPELIDDVASDATSPRGLVVHIKPGVYRSVTTALNNPEDLDRFTTIVTLKLDLRWGDAQTDELDTLLKRRGFRREHAPQWELIEVWSKGTNE